VTPTTLPLTRVARLTFWVAAIVVLYFALAPVPDREPLTGWDKTNHVAAFAGLAVLGLLGWASRARIVLAGLIGYGVFIEVLQLATVDHHFDLHDLAADAIGLAMGSCVLRAWRYAAARLT
jgi:LPXTG-motif cell wall-anchored protein